jgi:tripartite-type tricarboxylate transporter receptor subunit TctC
MKKLLAVIFCLLALTANAKTYKVFVGTPAGSGSDIQTRRLFDEVGKITGDTFVVFNKPGANLMIGYKSFIEESMREPNVILHGGSVYAVNAYLLKDTTIDPINELKGLVLTQYVTSLVVVRNDSPYNSLKDLTGRINAGVSNPLSEFLLASEVPKNNDFQIVNYKSDNESTMALLSKTVDVVGTTTFNPYLKSHADSLKVIHTHYTQVGSGYAVYKTFPEDERIKLNKALNEVLRNPEVVEWLTSSFRFKPVGGAPEKYDQMLIDMKKAITKHQVR